MTVRQRVRMIMSKRFRDRLRRIAIRRSEEMIQICKHENQEHLKIAIRINRSPNPDIAHNKGVIERHLEKIQRLRKQIASPL